ncbi:MULTISPECIES: hypothetical protein [Mycobacteriaceae]|uniref:Intersectin-EH binding protein Ibp1 n=4 Tax=Mycobacteriaceae TaxID=1762 RepID=A0A4R8QUH3_9MYCO|nr:MULTISPECIES: hypothetical protein [Mycobacteriaceae]AMT69438.1 hypothetical protein ABG82_02840 [Mycobacteroides immunogenum]ANO02477.1 hypothetical protein BAB75_02845 [Mycobacteroides immunogenum]KIU38722.1 hypothetical protein TL11_20870 [Mycobacteroides immunogenum]KPG08591.1 hypothetical protein AN909_14915 [Mycobacteroides immunogenum]KPG08844.1 hypothetical protein AN910_18220 [Mycobacteroides immunogenum]
MHMTMFAALAMIGAAGVAGLATPAPADADPPPPPVCYAAKPSVNAIEHIPCLAPGSVQYPQGVHQPTYGGANPLVPYGTNPLVPFGTNQNNAG